MLSARAIHFAADAPYYPAKTPARGAKSRSENAYQGAMTIQNAKGKANVMRTPFQPKTAEPQRLLKDGLGLTKASIHLVNRSSKPLADKTPFANRILNIYNTPGPEKKSLNFANPNKPLEQHNPIPDTGSTRASSTRKHPRVPKPADNRFQTPANQGNYWDVSEGEIIVPEMEQVLEMEEHMDYNDEIEYMAPNTLDLAYEPPFDFDLPDYKVLGQATLRSFYCYPQDHLPPPTFDFHIEVDDFMKWDSLSLSPLSSDDGSSQPSKHPQNTSAQTTTKMNAATTSNFRTGSMTTRPNTRATSRPATVASTRRPATAASIRPPPPMSSAKSTIRPSSTMTIRGATTTTPAISATITRKPFTATSRITTAPKKQPLTHPTSTRPTTTAQPATNATAIRPRAATTTTMRTTSRPPTSTSISRPLTSASVRTAPSGSTVKSSTFVVKSTPVPMVVKKSAKPSTITATATATTTRSKAATTTTSRVPVVSRTSATKTVIPKATTSKHSAAAKSATSNSQPVNLELTTLQVVEDGKGAPLDPKVEDYEGGSSPIELPIETESLEGSDRKVGTIQEEDSFTQENEAAYESNEALEADLDEVGNEGGMAVSFGSGSA